MRHPPYTIPRWAEDVVELVGSRSCVMHSTPAGPIECSGPSCPLCRQGVRSSLRKVYTVISLEYYRDGQKRDYIPHPGYDMEGHAPTHPGKWWVIRVTDRKYVWDPWES